MKKKTLYLPWFLFPWLWKKLLNQNLYWAISTTTICPRSSDPLYIVTYYMKLVTTSWTRSMYIVPILLTNQKWNTCILFRYYCFIFIVQRAVDFFNCKVVSLTNKDKFSIRAQQLLEIERERKNHSESNKKNKIYAKSIQKLL